MYRLLHTASALSSSSPTTAASSSSPPPPRPPPPHRPRVLLVPITRHCLADLLSQRHHQSHGGRRPRVPFAGSTVVVRSADGVNSATVVQCSIPNACRAVLSTAVPSLSDPPPPPQCRLCRPVCQHLRTLRRLIFLRALQFATELWQKFAINIVQDYVNMMIEAWKDQIPNVRMGDQPVRCEG
uniref:Uncharacterized protein n=1 Tax=Oryza meridionalis TaxID=40149 RepID=A0A0E0C2U1_9ORYZ